MAEIAPFRGLLYTASAGDPSKLLAPPYDVISPAGREELCALDPHNCVRLILPEAPASAAPGADKYAEAARTLTAWTREGIVGRDEKPAVYRYHQRYRAYGEEVVRKGFIARVRLHRFDEGVILPHERTLSGPKLDRLQLMRATRAHFSQIFGLYPDPARESDAAFAELEREPPAIEGTTSDGVTQRLWRLTDRRRIAELSRFMAERKVYIADGHHRYETMLALREELRPEALKRCAEPSRSSVEFGSMFFCNMDDPGLVVFPTHRVLFGLAGFDLERLLERAARWFVVSEGPEAAKGAAKVREALAAEAERGTCFGVVAAGRERAAILRVRGDLDLDALPAVPKAPELRALDVTVLHSIVLETLLGLDRGAQERQENLRYVKDWDAALAEREADGVQAVFLMNPTRVSQVKAVADAGEVMPQKSTFFYPKIASGLVMNPIDPSEVVD